MNRALPWLLMVPVVALAAEVPMSAEALARYRQASASIQAGAAAEAIPVLNALASEYPRVAEVFAARCSAQAATKGYAGAQADCSYALALKPNLPGTIYTLAIAQEALGNNEAAAASFRRYAAYDQNAAPYRDRALARASALVGAAAPTNNIPAAGKLVAYHNHLLPDRMQLTLVLDNRMVGDLGMDQYVEIETTPGEHVLEVRGQSENAFYPPRVWTRPLRLGAESSYVNLDLVGGKLTLQEVPAAQARKEIKEDCKHAYSRRITSESIAAPPVAQPQPVVSQLLVGGSAPAPECRMGSNGRQVCGFNCRIGSDGIPACADTPNGVCAIGSNGRVTCSQLGGSRAIGGPAPECRMGSNGQNTCGYNCRLGSGGSFYCASRPDGECALNSDGTWTCP